MTAIAILGADPNAQALARDMERRARAGERVDPSLTAASIAIVAAGGGPDDYEVFLEARKTAKTPQEQLRYLYALADFRDAVLLDRTLHLALTDEVRPQHVPMIYIRAVTNRDHGERGWRFLKEHWDEIVKRIPPSLVVYLADGVRYLITPELIEDTEKFFAAHPIPQSALQLRQTLERQRVNAELRRRAVPDLSTFFSAPSA